MKELNIFRKLALIFIIFILSQNVQSFLLQNNQSFIDSCQQLSCRQCFNGKCGKYASNKDFMNQYNSYQSQFLKNNYTHNPSQIKFPLSTSGMNIIDSSGKRVKITAVNWYGFQLQRQIISGLDKRSLSQIVSQIKLKFGINTIRLPFSIQMVYQKNPVNPSYLVKNPILIGKTPLQVMDAIIQQLTKQYIMVYLNNHNSDSGWCCSKQDNNGLWYNNHYSQQQYFSALQLMANRYKKNPLVIGIDIRNQIRATQIKNPLWTNYTQYTDVNWRKAAKTVSDRIHKIASHWLIIIGGINYQTDFLDIVKWPIQLQVPHKLIYSGHIYSWSYPQSTWSSYLQAYSTFFDNQFHVRGLGVPFLIGQFGTNSQINYWRQLINVLKNTDFDWTYWALDGYKNNPNEDQTFGLYNSDFSTIRHTWKAQDLKIIGANSYN